MLARACASISLILAFAGTTAPAAAAEKPNILIVVADDLGWADVGFHSPRIKTPNLDRLAKDGLALDQHYVAPVCSPTRTGLMTGRYWSRFGVNSPVNRRCLAFDTVTLAAALKSVGYDTAITGKWHLGSKPEWGPRKFGFDHSYGSLAGGVGPYDHRYKTGPYSQTWHRDDVLIEEQGHVTDLIAAEAVRWLETRTERPFFLYLPFTAVHIPIDEPQQWLDANPQIQDVNERLFAAVTTHMDDALGRVLAALERTNKRHNTLVIFFSDNGGYPTARNDDPKYPGKYRSGPVGGCNEPLRGMKTELYEGGIRTAALANWPGRLPRGTLRAPIHVADWMPTLCRLVGYEPPKDLHWDGRDVWPLLQGKPVQPRTLYWLGVNGRSAAVRDGDWKLIVAKQGKQPDELFDLAADPYEKNNLAAAQPERVARLKTLLKEQAARDNDAVVPEQE